MAKKAASTVGLELSPTYLKLVEFLPRENQIAVVAIKPLEPSGWRNDEYLAEEIRGCVEKYVQSGRTELVACVPGEYAVIREVEVPNNEDNILDAVHWEMEQYVTGSLEDYLLDFQPLGSTRDESGKAFLAVAFRRAEVERLKGVFDSSGASLAVMDVDVFAAQNIFEVNYPEKRALRTFLVKADSHSVKCLRTHHGRFLGLENFRLPEEFPGLEGEAKARVVRDFAAKVKNSLDSCASQWGPVEETVLCGDLAMDDEFREALRMILPMDILSLNAFKEVAFALSPEKASVFAPTAPHCAAAVGLALRRWGDC